MIVDEDKLCPLCLRLHDAGLERCPSDGTPLLTSGRALLARAGETIDGRFTLLAPIGAGGMGAIWRARQHSMDRDVAVKLMHASFAASEGSARRFLTEARAVSRLTHPNIVTVFDFGQTAAGELYLVMELIEGETLGARLRREGALSPAHAVAIAVQACEALQHAHDRGVVHRDLKPENILLTPGVRPRDHVKVVDFGVAKVEGLSAELALTRSGANCGTPTYMSPEQAMGIEVGPASDIHAVGLILFEALTLVRPFGAARTPLEILSAHAHEQAPRIRTISGGQHVPAQLERVLVRSLQKRVTARPASAAALAAELEDALVADLGAPDTTSDGQTPSAASVPRALTSLGIATSPETLEPPARSSRPELERPQAAVSVRAEDPRPPASTRRALVPAAALLTVLLGIGAGWTWVHLRRTEPPALTPSPAAQPGAVIQPASLPVHSVLPVPAAVSPGVPAPHPISARPSAPAAGPVPSPPTAASERAATDPERATDSGVPVPTPTLASLSTGPSSPPELKLRIDSDPPGARVRRGEEELGPAPVYVDPPAGNVALSFSLPGHKSRTIELRPGVPVPAVVHLQVHRRPTDGQWGRRIVE